MSDKSEKPHRKARTWTWAAALLGLLANVIVSGIVGYYLNKQLVSIDKALSIDLPSCANPLDLVPLDMEEISASGPWYFQDDGISAEPVSELKDFENLRPSESVDGILNTLWVPPSDSRGGTTFEPKSGAATLTLQFPRGDVQLVCVVNGWASNSEKYRNWGRVRTLETTTDQGMRTSSLRSLGDCCFQNSQQVNIAKGETGHVDLTITSAYSGQTVLTYDGDFCDRETQVDGPMGEEGPVLDGQRIRGSDPDDPTDPDDGWELAIPRGCYAGAEPKAGIADVTIYMNP